MTVPTLKKPAFPEFFIQTIEESPLVQLPQEVWEIVIAHLPIHDLMNVSMLNKHFREIVECSNWLERIKNLTFGSYYGLNPKEDFINFYSAHQNIFTMHQCKTLYSLDKKIHAFEKLTDDRIITCFEGKITFWQADSKGNVQSCDRIQISDHHPHLLRRYDNTSFASADFEGQIYLWKVADKISTKRFDHGATVLDVIMISENMLMSCGEDQYIRIWDTQNQQCIQKEQLLDDVVRNIALLDKENVLWGTERGQIIVVRNSDLEFVRFVQAHDESPVTAVCVVNPTLIISGSTNGTICLWNPVNNQTTEITDSANLCSQITHIVYHPLGFIVCALKSGKICFYECNSLTLRQIIDTKGEEVVDLKFVGSMLFYTLANGQRITRNFLPDSQSVLEKLTKKINNLVNLKNTCIEQDLTAKIQKLYRCVQLTPRSMRESIYKEMQIHKNLESLQTAKMAFFDQSEMRTTLEEKQYAIENYRKKFIG